LDKLCNRLLTDAIIIDLTVSRSCIIMAIVATMN